MKLVRWLRGYDASQQPMYDMQTVTDEEAQHVHLNGGEVVGDVVPAAPPAVAKEDEDAARRAYGTRPPSELLTGVRPEGYPTPPKVKDKRNRMVEDPEHARAVRAGLGVPDEDPGPTPPSAAIQPQKAPERAQDAPRAPSAPRVQVSHEPVEEEPRQKGALTLDQFLEQATQEGGLQRLWTRMSLGEQALRAAIDKMRMPHPSESQLGAAQRRLEEESVRRDARLAAVKDARISLKEAITLLDGGADVEAVKARIRSARSLLRGVRDADREARG